MTSKKSKNAFMGTPIVKHIAEMPLTTAIDRFQRLAEDNDFLETTVHAVDSDTAFFEMCIRRNGVLTAVVRGKMQSWAGDATLIEGYNIELSKRRIQYTQIFLWLTIIAAIVFTFARLVGLEVITSIVVSVFFMIIVYGVLTTDSDESSQRNKGYLVNPTALYIDPMDSLRRDRQMLRGILEQFAMSNASVSYPETFEQKAKINDGKNTP